MNLSICYSSGVLVIPTTEVKLRTALSEVFSGDLFYTRNFVVTDLSYSSQSESVLNESFLLGAYESL